MQSVSTGSVTSGYNAALSTYFANIGEPYSGCGVPPEKLVDDSGKDLPWVALNTNSEFSNGKNCGRFIAIRLGKNCVGAGNSNNAVCVGGRARPPTATPLLVCRAASCPSAAFRLAAALCPLARRSPRRGPATRLASQGDPMMHH